MKTALITGSSGLIGRELAREFLAQGYNVIGLDLNEGPKLQHPGFTFIKTDISSEAQVKKAFSRIKSLDVLVNNAAKSDPKNKKLHLLDLKSWNDGLAVNLTSIFLLSKHAIPLLKKSKGSIINMSSTRHLMSEPDTEIYSASKGATDALTRSMAISLGPEIRVNSISPGWINDPEEKLPKAAHEQHPVGRVGRPEDIATMAIFLANEVSGFVTGADFVVDGGMTTKMIYKD